MVNDMKLFKRKKKVPLSQEQREELEKNIQEKLSIKHIIGTPKIHHTAIPGGLLMEEWEKGAWSKYNHPGKSKDNKLKKAI